MITLKIEVGLEDIRGAKRKNCRDFPTSRAITRSIQQTPELSEYFQKVDTHYFGIVLPYIHDLEYWGYGFDYITIPLPKNVKQRIELYDITGYMEPFSFNIEVTIPGDALKLGIDFSKHQQRKKDEYYSKKAREEIREEIKEKGILSFLFN